MNAATGGEDVLADCPPKVPALFGLRTVGGDPPKNMLHRRRIAAEIVFAEFARGNAGGFDARPAPIASSTVRPQIDRVVARCGRGRALSS